MRTIPPLLGGLTIMMLLTPGGVPACRTSGADGWTNSLAPKGEPGAEVTLAKDATTDHVILVPVAPTPQEQRAAEELGHWLQAMTGATFPVLEEGTRQAPPAAFISVGRTRALAEARLPDSAPDLGDEGYAIGQRGADLYLFGGRKRGPLHAVFALLEEDLGCRWYTPDAARIPNRATLRFRPVPRHYVPPLVIRDPFYSDAWDPTWSLRNRTNAPSASVPGELGGNVRYALFCHTFDTLVPPSEYFEGHPDYYMLTEAGERIRKQLCLTHPDVIEILTTNVQKILQSRPGTDLISVSYNDGQDHCHCPECRAINDANESVAGTLIALVNHVAEAIESDHPGVMVSTLAYGETLPAPTQLRPRHNVAVRVCNNLHAWRYPFLAFATCDRPESREYRKHAVDWSRICRHVHVWDYCANYSHFLAPMPNLHTFEPDVRFYVEQGVEGLMYQGNSRCTGERTRLRSWAMAKLFWDPTLEMAQLVADFTWGYYGPAAPFILAYDALLLRNCRQHGEAAEAPDWGNRYYVDHPMFSEQFLARAADLFDQAAAHADSDAVRRRVQLARLPLLYVQLCQGLGFLQWPGEWRPGPRPGAVTEGRDYAAMFAEFEAIARREGVTHLTLGPPDFDERVDKWREMLGGGGQ